MLLNQAVNNHGSPDGGAQLRGLDEGLLGGAFGNVQNIAGQKANIFGFKLHDLLEIDRDLALLATGILAHDNGAIGLGGTACAPLEMPGIAAEVAPACAEAVESARGSADDGEKGFDGAGAAAESAGRGVGATSCGLIGGGVASSEGSVSARVTITDSPASGVIPPASARTSSKVTWRSAW